MSKLREKLNSLEKNKIKDKWQSLDSEKGMSTREKLEKLVNLSLRRESLPKNNSSKTVPFLAAKPDDNYENEGERNAPFTCREYNYPYHSVFGKIELSQWMHIAGKELAMIFGDQEYETLSPMKLLFFDTETTGLAGGTGTIPFMLGFGFFTEAGFQVKIYVLNDLAREDTFLEEIDRFLTEHKFEATVTYNGKSFDFPLMETRYILQRKRFPLLKLPHLDFLFPARTLWKHTCESRKLGYLGDILLGLSRDEDIDSSQIPTVYFNYLRTRSFHLLEKVVEHNALDLVGLSALLLLAALYVKDVSFTRDEGEVLGLAKMYEKCGDFTEAIRFYNISIQSGERQEITNIAMKNLAVIQKKEKLYDEALQWCHLLVESDSGDQFAVRELSVHFEHREKNFSKALEYAQQALNTISLTDSQRKDFEKRLKRLKRKIAALDKEE